MRQKENSLVWRLIALLSVLSIGMSLFAMSSTLTYAAARYPLPVRIFRPFSSTVGAVRVTVTRDNAVIVNPVCIPLPQQQQDPNTQLSALVPVKDSSGQELQNQDTIKIENFPNAQCQLDNLFPKVSDNETFNNLVRRLPVGPKSCSSLPEGHCRLYTTPGFA